MTIAKISDYGLHINTYPLPTAQFTSLPLENGNQIKTLGKNIHLEFDTYVRKDNIFGSVFRLITNNNTNIDLMFSATVEDARAPYLLIEKEVISMNNKIEEEVWVKVKLSLDIENEKIILIYDGESVEKSCKDLGKIKSFRVAFGRCPFDGFVLDDVASVNIRNVSISRDNKQIRFWKMGEHLGDTCYDEIKNSPAVGQNTKWLIDDYISWKKIYREDFNKAPSISFDSINNSFFISTDKNIYILNADTYFLDELIVKGGISAVSSPNQVIFIPDQDKLLAYNLTENIFSVFDFNDNVWINQKHSTEDNVYWNSTVSFNSTDSTLISFGGYGHYLYKNELLYCYPFDSNKQPERIKISEISPRYSPASVIVDEELYVFGGRGSSSGRQELFPRNYYDLYSINLKDKTVNKKWELLNTPDKGDFVPSENMIYDDINNCFYVFTSQLGGVLTRINTDSAHLEQVSLPIGITYNTHYIYSNLFYSPSLQKLFTSILLAEVDGKSSLEIYEINYPPISIDFAQQSNFTANTSKFNTWPYIIFLLLTILISFIATKYILQKKKKDILKKIDEDSAPIVKQEIITTLPKQESGSAVSYYNFSKQSICLLGRFGVYNKEGEDKTSLFSPILRSLLTALILYSKKDSRGISGNKLIQLLWFDKNEEAAKNNRNVYISKLRSILTEIGDIRIINDNGFWRISFENDTYCDYLELMKLFEKKNDQQINKILELLNRGPLLPNMEEDWLDSFKNVVANMAIDYSHNILQIDNLSDGLSLSIANILFEYDFLSEEALQIKCSILYKQSKIGLAKSVYDSFCEEYKSALNTNYSRSFLDIVGAEE